MKFFLTTVSFCLLLALVVSRSEAQTENPPDPVPPSVETAEKVTVAPAEILPLEEALFTTPRAPYKYFGSFNYAAIDVPIIAKYGITAGYISDRDHIWEFEYMTGSFGSSLYFADIGRITDTKISIQRRAYFGNHFNIKYGLSYFNFSAKLGDALMSNVSNNNYPSLDMVEIEAYGASFGMGSTWTFNKNIVLSVDWLTVSQPLYVTKKETPYLDYSTDPDDRDEVETATDIVTYMPRVSLIQFHVGMMF